MATEAAIYDAVRDVLAALSGPAWTVRDHMAPLDQLPPLTICMAPLQTRRIGAIGDKQLFALEILIACRTKIVEALGNQHRFTSIFGQVRGVCAALRTAAALAPGGSAGVQEMTRGEVDWWYVPSANVGAGGGGIFTLTCQFVDD